MGQFIIENNVQHTGWVEGYEPRQDKDEAPFIYNSLEDAMDVLSRYFGVLHDRTGDFPNAAEYRVRDLETDKTVELKDSEHNRDTEPGHFVTETMDIDGGWDSILLPDPEEDGEMVRPVFSNMTDAIIAVMMDIDIKSGGLPRDHSEMHEFVKKTINETRYRVRNLDTDEAVEVRM